MNKTKIAVASLLFLLASVMAEASDFNISRLNKKIKRAKYEWCSNYNHGMAVVCKNSKFGAINKEGEEIVACQYDNFGFCPDMLYCGLPYRSTFDGLFFINEVKNDSCTDCMPSYNYYFADTSGRTFGPYAHHSLFFIGKDGDVRYFLGGNNPDRMAVFDNKGNVLTNYSYSAGGVLKKGKKAMLFLISKETSAKSVAEAEDDVRFVSSLCDTGGTPVRGWDSSITNIVPIEYDKKGEKNVVGGYYRVSKMVGSSQLWGLANEKLEIVKPIEYDQISIRGDSASLSLKGTNGKETIYVLDENKYKEYNLHGRPHYKYENGYWEIERNGKYGLLDSLGGVIFPMECDWIYADRRGSLNCFYCRKYAGNKTERYIERQCPMGADDCFFYKDGTTIVIRNGKWYAERGGKVISEAYDSLSVCANTDYVLFKKGKSGGCLKTSDYRTRVFTSVKFDYSKFVYVVADNHLMQIEKNLEAVGRIEEYGERWYYDMDGNLFFPSMLKKSRVVSEYMDPICISEFRESPEKRKVLWLKDESGHFGVVREDDLKVIVPFVIDPRTNGELLSNTFGYFNEGLAPVKINGVWRYVDEDGNGWK